jgi:hypothetical protein
MSEIKLRLESNYIFAKILLQKFHRGTPVQYEKSLFNIGRTVGEFYNKHIKPEEAKIAHAEETGDAKEVEKDIRILEDDLFHLAKVIHDFEESTEAFAEDKVKQHLNALEELFDNLQNTLKERNKDHTIKEKSLLNEWIPRIKNIINILKEERKSLVTQLETHINLINQYRKDHTKGFPEWKRIQNRATDLENLSNKLAQSLSIFNSNFEAVVRIISDVIKLYNEKIEDVSNEIISRLTNVVQLFESLDKAYIEFQRCEERAFEDFLSIISDIEAMILHLITQYEDELINKGFDKKKFDKIKSDLLKDEKSNFNLLYRGLARSLYVARREHARA